MARDMAPPAIPLAPVTATERISAVDMLRGFALLGILPVNAVAFALPLAAYVTPMNDAVNAYRGPFAGVAAAAWLVPHFLCDLKMMTIFSMLFGAGLVLMNDRVARRGGSQVGSSGDSNRRDAQASFARIYYRRLGVLALIGLFHGFAIWYGDILVYYALSGSLLYPLRQLKPAPLFLAASVLFAAQLGLNRWEGEDVAEVHATAVQADRDVAQGLPLTEDQFDAREEWESIEADHDPTPAQVAREIDRVRGTFASALRRNTEMISYNLTSSELLFWWLRALTAMLAGMALMKLGIFSAQRTTRLYSILTCVGYGIGMPIVGIGVWQLWHHRFEPVYLELAGRQYNVVGSWFVALGHVGLVMLVCKYQLFWRLTARLAAVGRMALTNYLSQSIIGAFVFSGWGLGLFARWTHAQVLLFTLGIWIAQLTWSPWWLRRFRYGPAEWLWRSATYGEWQSMSVVSNKE
jgi:uncharacterized protein